MFDSVSAAEAILARLEASSSTSDELRRLDNDAVAAMKEAGLARLYTPKRFGGYELAPRHHILACAKLAHGCTAAAWVLMVCGAHSYVVGRFAEECQKEVFGTDPDVLIAGTLAAQGTIKPTSGGWILDGRWQFGSGVDHSPWLLIGARPAEKGYRAQHVVVPKADLEVDDTWYTLGMRGSGSKDLVARGVFVPSYRAMESGPLFLGTFVGSTAPVYRLPVSAGLATMLAATVLGMAEKGLKLFLAATKARSDIYFGSRKAANPQIQRRAGEAAAELETARLLIERMCDDLDAAMAKDQPPMEVKERARIRRNAAYVAELSRRAVDRLFTAAGAHAIYDHSALLRIHRDITTATHHQMVDFDSAAELFGRIALDLEPGLPDSVI
ncbi:MAG TPA: acyl-CoA dehydrogenase family protein [Candidatus Binataceae bacterium]|nr:acyl-CoA dehydrogenase family protein [Candidatus Binataceae bacterium]